MKAKLKEYVDLAGKTKKAHDELNDTVLLIAQNVIGKEYSRMTVSVEDFRVKLRLNSPVFDITNTQLQILSKKYELPKVTIDSSGSDTFLIFEEADG